MEIIDFVHALLRRWWLVVLCGFVGMGVAFLWRSDQPSLYESTVTLQLNPSATSALLPYGTNPNEYRSVNTLAASYAEVLRSRSFGETAVRELGLSLPPEAIAGAISARLVPNTNLFRISVTWSNPQDAQTLAQAIAELFVSENMRRQEGQPTPDGQPTGRLSELQQTAATYPARIEALRRQRDQLDQAVARGDLSRLPELTSLDTRLSTLESSYANLLIEISRLRANLDTASIIDPASPARPLGVTPRSQALLFGLLIGLVTAMGIVYVLRTLDDSIRHPQDVVLATGAAPLTTVGHLDTDKWDPPLRESGLVAIVEPHGLVAEAFRTLLTNLRLAATEQPLKVVLITSGLPEEGKTLVASNLAVAYAQAGDRVLLIDGDLRRPRVHIVFGVPNEVGLVDALAAESAATAHANGALAGAASPARGRRGKAPVAIVEPVPMVPGIVDSGVENLWVLPAGQIPQQDATRLLARERLAPLMESLRQAWDMVVIDSAPVGPISDGLLLAATADASLLVVRAGRTRRRALRSLVQAMQKSGRPVLGTILNDFRLGRLERYGLYGHGYGYYKTYHRYYGAIATRGWRDEVKG